MLNVQDESLPQTKSAACELPPPDTERWTPRRKASVVDAVLSGVMSLEEVHRRYGLSVKELRSWNNAMKRYGTRGLYITKLQKYRYPPTLRQRGVPAPGESTNLEDLMRPPQSRTPVLKTSARCPRSWS